MNLVAKYSMAKLLAEKLEDCYKEMALLLQKMSMNVAAVFIDNASTNRKSLFIVYLNNNGLCHSHAIDQSSISDSTITHAQKVTI
jgi:hypothetical protein